MHFGVDAHAIGRRLTGNEVYVSNLLNSFALLDQTSQFTAYYAAESAIDEIPARFHRERVSANPFIRLGVDLTSKLRAARPDLIHVQYTAPLGCPVPVVVSVHDVSYLERPEFFQPSRVAQLRLTVKRTVCQAVRILTPSEFSKRGVINAYGIASDLITVTPNAVSHRFRPIPREVASARIQARFDFHGPFILCVGDLQPRKNHVGLVEAFCKLLTDHPQLPHHLVIAGKDTWYSGKVREAAAATPFASRIHFPGWVADEDLVNFYGACDLFVFPSHYEGFGIPILEAMACGRAVACSNTSAMPEVANATALLFDPLDRGDIVRSMRDLLLDSELRVRMERLGIQRAALYSWQNTARQTLDAYYEVARRHSKDRAAAVRA